MLGSNGSWICGTKSNRPFRHANQQRTAQATQRNRESKDKFWIQNSVDDSIFSKITGAGTSKQAWDILKSTYQGNDRVKKGLTADLEDTL